MDLVLLKMMLADYYHQAVLIRRASKNLYLLAIGKNKCVPFPSSFQLHVSLCAYD